MLPATWFDGWPKWWKPPSTAKKQEAPTGPEQFNAILLDLLSRPKNAHTEGGGDLIRCGRNMRTGSPRSGRRRISAADGARRAAAGHSVLTRGTGRLLQIGRIGTRRVTMLGDAGMRLPFHRLLEHRSVRALPVVSCHADNQLTPLLYYTNQTTLYSRLIPPVSGTITPGELFQGELIFQKCPKWGIIRGKGEINRDKARHCRKLIRNLRSIQYAYCISYTYCLH